MRVLGHVQQKSSGWVTSSCSSTSTSGATRCTRSCACGEQRLAVEAQGREGPGLDDGRVVAPTRGHGQHRAHEPHRPPLQGRLLGRPPDGLTGQCRLVDADDDAASAQGVHLELLTGRRKSRPCQHPADVGPAAGRTVPPVGTKGPRRRRRAALPPARVAGRAWSHDRCRGSRASSHRSRGRGVDVRQHRAGRPGRGRRSRGRGRRRGGRRRGRGAGRPARPPGPRGPRRADARVLPQPAGHASRRGPPGRATRAGRQRAPRVAERRAAAGPAACPVAAVFDTRVSKVRRLPAAAGPRAVRLARRRDSGCSAAPEAFLVSDIRGPLVDGELERAAAWGHALAGELTSRVSPRAHST